jgi:histidine triad (HIT) family protein
MSGVFTKIINREIPAHILLEDEHFIAFLDVNPLVQGHALVVPKAEVDYLFDLDDSTLSDIMLFARKVAVAIKKVVPCRKIGVSVVGLEVPHAHVHLIPINHVEDMSFARPKLKPDHEELASIADHIRRALQQ